MFHIRNYGNDITCHDIAEMVAAVGNYRDTSITIEDKRPGGQIFFVDIGIDGTIRESYGQERVIDLQMLLAQPCRPAYPATELS